MEKGLEPDECFYIQHELQMRDKDEVDLKQDPPPDLVVEVDITHHPIDRAAIYAMLGVPEIWRYDGRGLQALRGFRREWPIPQNRKKSRKGFPFLRPSELSRFSGHARHAGENRDDAEAFRDWVRAGDWK